MWQQLNILRTNGKITPLYVGVRLLASKRFFNFSVLWSYSQKESLNCLQLRRLSTIVKRRVTSVRARPLVILRGLIQALSRAQLTQEAEWDLAAKLCRSLCVEKNQARTRSQLPLERTLIIAWSMEYFTTAGEHSNRASHERCALAVGGALALPPDGDAHKGHHRREAQQAQQHKQPAVASWIAKVYWQRLWEYNCARESQYIVFLSLQLIFFYALGTCL